MRDSYDVDPQSSRDSSSASKKSAARKSAHDSKSKQVKRTGGVADYFTILGVGDDLLWKHTQKQREEQQLLEQQQQQQRQQQQGETSTDSSSENHHQKSHASALSTDPNQEDQAALLERFYREIIDVTIVTHQERSINIMQHPSPPNPPSSVAPASSIILASSPSVDTDINTTDGTSTNSLASSRVRSFAHHHHHHHHHHSLQQQPSILPSPSSHSDATTVATTVLSTSDTAGAGGSKPTTSQPPSEIDGFTVLARTHPPQKSNNSLYSSHHPTPVWNPSLGGSSSYYQQPSPSNHHNNHNIGNPLSTSFSQGLDTPVCHAPFPWNQPSSNTHHHHNHSRSNINNQQHHPHQNGGNNKDSGNSTNYIFDANLGSVLGLRDQVCATVYQFEESSSSSDHGNHTNNQHHQHPSSSNASVGGSSSAGASLKGLRRKMESSWKKWNHQQGHNNSPNHDKHSRYTPHPQDYYSTHHPSHSSTTTTTKFYLGYKRRTPDQDHVPAIADLKLFYLRLPRQATTRPPTRTNSTLMVHSPANSTATSPPGSSTAGYLAGRVAAAAGHVLFRSQQHTETPVMDTNTPSNNHPYGDDGASADQTVTTTSGHHQHEDFQRVELKPLIPLPDGFDDWAIPEAFKVIYLPKPPKTSAQSGKDRPESVPSTRHSNSTNNTDALRQKTVLVASPSHSHRRPQQHNEALAPTTANHDEELDGHPVSSMNSSTDEAVEAYVAGSFSSPVSPNPQADDEESVQHLRGTPETRKPVLVPEATTTLAFVPELFTDIPWEDDQNDEGPQYHHPFYHTEERWWYIPVLAVRKQRTGDEERFHEDAGIVDLAVSFCDKAGIAAMPQEQDDFFSDDIMMDDGDDEFSLLSKTSWLVACDGDNSCLPNPGINEGSLLTGTGTKKPKQKAGFTAVQKSLGSPALLVKRNVPIGFTDLAFATRVLDRFPLKNYKGLPLPEEELPMFCYPTGCKLLRAPFSDAPLPEYYGFVVKNERGDSIYVSCVSFFEPLTTRKIDQLANMSEKRRRTSLAHRRYCEKRERRRLRKQGHLYNSDNAEPVAEEVGFAGDDEDDESDNCILTGFDTMTTFENKTICLVSRYPFWTAFRRFLSHLHILAGSSSDLPLERCISHLLLTVPVPRHGGPNVIVPLPALNQPMILSLPPLKDFPLVDLPYQRLMACLDIPTIVTLVLGFLALERKVVVMSTRPSLVLDACELLRPLLFPFELCAPYVPRLTEPFMSCLEFPGAIFVGIHDDGCSDGLAAVVRKSPPEDSIIVDLDSGSISCSGNRYEVLSSAWDIIPSSARSMLVSELETLCRDAEIVPGQEPLDSCVDSAFDATLPAGLVEDFDEFPASHESREPLDDRAIRDAFLRFFCTVLKGYDRFLVVPDADFLISGNEWFDTQEFLTSAAKENSAFLQSFVSTQLFQSFIQRRTEDSDVHCLLFDECITEFASTPMPYGRLGNDVETVVSSDQSQPHMLYSLLVDQSASAPYNGIPNSHTNNISLIDPSNTMLDKSSVGDLSRDGADSDFDSSSYPFSKPSMSATTDISDRLTQRGALDSSDNLSLRNSESMITPTGDIVTAPSRTDLPVGVNFVYCVDGNPCFPHRLNKSLFLPSEPDSWLVEMSKIAPNPSLARSEREVEEANRRRKSALSYRGLHTQKRCLWQLPKLMGSHFLGSWLLCIPSQVSQPDLSHEQQSRYLLRALGAIRLLRHKQRIIPDEAAYRALMVACGRTTSDRRVELVKLFGLLRSDGIFPSAVTLGQYTRALAEGYSKRSATELPEENFNDFNGVEVTESMSMVRGTSGGGRSSLYGGMGDAESALLALDGNLANLESAGRKWRQRTNLSTERPGSTKTSGNTNASADRANASKVADERHHRKRQRSWLPVVVASSFVPSTTHGLNNVSSLSNSGKLPADSVRLIALWSRTCACDSCGYIPLEEEVQAGWDSLGDNDVLGAISCPRCGSMIIPMLGYREMSLEEALELKDPCPQNINDADFAGLPPQLGPHIDPGIKKVSFVTYISPATLRLSLERYIDEMGENILSRERLKEVDPEVFYNFFWYCARFNLPLPLPVVRDGEEAPKHCIAFAAWERTAAERGCYSGAKAVSTLLANNPDKKSSGLDGRGEMGAIDPFDEFPLLGRYNLQGFHPSVWDHPDLSEILVSLVTVCDSDRRDFKVVIECVLRCNQRRREEFGDGKTDTGSDVHCPVDLKVTNDGMLSPTEELDCYKTILYLAKYQCTTAFHTFFPAVAKPCKGYHYWCALGTPLPIFDRLLREAIKRVNSKGNSFAPIPDVSDVALGFRCVFGHLI